MQIQIKDNSRNGVVVVRNFNAQRKVERQLDEILSKLYGIKNQLLEEKNQLEKMIYE